MTVPLPAEPPLTDTRPARTGRARSPEIGGRGACLVHIYPTGASMGRRYVLGESAVVLGRGDDCDVQIVDNSVSRRHARVAPAPEGYAAEDLGSTNGTYVNDRPCASPLPLRDGDYLRAGNCLYRFLAGGNVEVEYHEEIYRLAIVDGLTRAHNRRALDDFLDREVTRAARHARPLSVLLLDIDRFKAVNDAHGHLAGDFVLRELAAVVLPTVRREDLFARYGGEEFALVLVETGQADAVETGERVRGLVAAHPFRYEGAAVPLTVSVGVADLSEAPEMGPADLLRRADERLYAAKRAGRDRVVGGPPAAALNR